MKPFRAAAGEVSILRKFLRSVDWLQLGSILSLQLIGLVFIRSIGEQIGSRTSLGYFPKQIQWMVLGLVVYTVLAAVDYRKLYCRVGAVFLYLATFILLIAVLFVGLKINGATRWLDIAGFRLQPSEPAKLAIIAVVSMLFSSPWWFHKKFQVLCGGTLAVILPFWLIAKEPDLGNALMLIPIFFSMLFVAGLKWRYVFIVLLGSIGLLIFCYFDCQKADPLLLRGYQRNRIQVFLQPELDISGKGHNAYQAKLAVGSGGLYGKGIGGGTQNELGFLPQMGAHNDFIFSVIAEETGFFGVAGLLAIYLLLLYTMLRTAFFASPYGRLLASGIAMMMFGHIFISVGMSIGLAPVTGLALPLVSYGGSSTVSAMAAMGILQSIWVHRNDTPEKF